MAYDLEIKIKNKLDKIKKRYGQKYAAAIFDIEEKILKNGLLVLEGRVLSKIQKAQAEDAVKEVGADRIKNNIKVLCDPKEGAETGWGVVKPDIADIFSVFPLKRRKKFQSGRFRAAQTEKGDIVRILAEKERYLLAQKNDLTVGWIKKSQISKLKTLRQRRIRLWRKISKHSWINVKRAKIGKTLNILPCKSAGKRFISFLKKYLAVPYLWGGTTSKGLDCSGLTQKFYEEVFGILLPKHSRDQALCGKTAGLKSARFGDLIFFRNKKNNFPHVGIVAESISRGIALPDSLREIWILNARKERGKTAIEDLPAILKTYKLISVKKII